MPPNDLLLRGKPKLPDLSFRQIFLFKFKTWGQLRNSTQFITIELPPRHSLLEAEDWEARYLEGTNCTMVEMNPLLSMFLVSPNATFLRSPRRILRIVAASSLVAACLLFAGESAFGEGQRGELESLGAGLDVMPLYDQGTSPYRYESVRVLGMSL